IGPGRGPHPPARCRPGHRPRTGGRDLAKGRARALPRGGLRVHPTLPRAGGLTAQDREPGGDRDQDQHDRHREQRARVGPKPAQQRFRLRPLRLGPGPGGLGGELAGPPDVAGFQRPAGLSQRGLRLRRRCALGRLVLPCHSGRAPYTNLVERERMAETSELIEFRRAFVWLLCGMLLPSVALVAFGVVAVANERAAVERRLAVEYDARLRTLSLDLLARLDRAADAVAARRIDPLVANIRPLASPSPELAEAARRAANLPIGGHVFANTDIGAERRAYALVRAVRESGEQTLLAQLDVAEIASQVQRLAELKYPREAAAFRLVPPREPVAALAALRRIVAEAGQAGTVVSRIALGPPLEAFALVAELPGDPAGPLAFRNRTLYIALLVLLYVGVGVGLTLREMRRAYKLSRLKTDFVANISHELRTPLTSVRLFAETLREGRAVGPEEVNECVVLLSAEAERL